MYTRNREEQIGNIELKTVTQAEEVTAQLAHDIKSIEEQLRTRQPDTNAYGQYKSWKRKAQIAMALKQKKLHFVKGWIARNGGANNIPSDEETMDMDFNMPAQNNRYADITKRPHPDRIIDNVCGAVIQLRGLKWRLYPYLKIASLAYDILDSGAIGESADELKYWLYRAGFKVEPPNRRESHSDAVSEEDAEYEDGLDDDSAEESDMSDFSDMPRKPPKF